MKETGDLASDFPLYSRIAHIKKDAKLRELRHAIATFHQKGPTVFDYLRKTILGERIKAAIKRPHSARDAPVVISTIRQGHPIGLSAHEAIKHDSKLLEEKVRSEEATRLLALMDSITFQNLPLEKRQRIEQKYWSIIGI